MIVTRGALVGTIYLPGSGRPHVPSDVPGDPVVEVMSCDGRSLAKRSYPELLAVLRGHGRASRHGEGVATFRLPAIVVRSE